MEKGFWHSYEKHIKRIEIGRNNDYTTGNLSDYDYFSTHYKLIATYSSKKIELENLNLKQQINFIGRLDKNNTAMFFITKKSEENTLEFSQNALIVIWFSFIIYQNGNSKDCKFIIWHW